MTDKVNLSLYFTEEDYKIMSSSDWPSYQDVIDGKHTDNPSVKEIIEKCINLKISEGVKFPIKTATSCQSKWTWSTIYLNQLSTASCHRVMPVRLNLSEFENFHNHPKKLDDRKLMLEGKWPQGGCEYCRDIENAGGFSDRQHNLEIRGLTPPEVEHDLTAINVTPRIVEIFAQNTCNFSCTYCNGFLSSKIEQENQKFGHFSQNGVVIPITNIPTTTKEVFDKFITWLDANITKLVRLHLLGGETFLQHELMNAVLDIIERRPNPNLEFCIFSNLNVPDKIWNQYITRIKDLQKRKHIRIFDLTASIDCWGAEAEYARFGLDLNRFEERMAWAANEDQSWLRLNVNQTITCLTMRTMSDLIKKIDLYSKNRHIGHYFQFYTGSQMFQHPNIFPYDFWKEDFKNIYQSMPNRTDNHKEAIQRMTGMEKYLQSFTTYNRNGISKLHILLDELDRRRNTNWREIFPYLNQQPK